MKLFEATPKYVQAAYLFKESLNKSQLTFLKEEAGIASDSQLNQLFKKIAKDLKGKGKTTQDPNTVDLNTVSGNTKQPQTEEVLTEGLVLTLLLASPTFLELLSKIIDWSYKKLMLSPEEQKQLDQYKTDYANAVKANDTAKIKELHDSIYASKVGKALDKFAHVAHKALLLPIEKLVYGIGWLTNDDFLKKDAEWVAELMYAVIMISVAGIGISHSLESISATKTAMVKLGTSTDAVSHLVTDSVKGGKLTIDLFKKIIGSFIKE